MHIEVRSTKPLQDPSVVPGGTAQVCFDHRQAELSFGSIPLTP